MLPDLFTLKTAKAFAAKSGNIHFSTRSYPERRLNSLDSVGTVYAILRETGRTHCVGVPQLITLLLALKMLRHEGQGFVM